jgi:hypothetical protein
MAYSFTRKGLSQAVVANNRYCLKSHPPLYLAAPVSFFAAWGILEQSASSGAKICRVWA